MEVKALSREQTEAFQQKMDELHRFLRTLNLGLAGVVATKLDTGSSNIIFIPEVLQNKPALAEVLADLRVGVQAYQAIFIDLPNTPPS